MKISDLIASMEAAKIPSEKILQVLKEHEAHKKEQIRLRVKKHRENSRGVTQNALQTKTPPEDKIILNISDPVTQKALQNGHTHDVTKNALHGKNCSDYSDPVTKNALHNGDPYILTMEDKNNNKEKKVNKHTGTRFDLVTLPEEWRTYCKSKRPDLDPDAVFEDFRDYWIAKPGAAALKLDWAATWRTWVRKQSAPNAGRLGFGAPGKAETTEERFNRMKSKGLLT